MGSSFSWAFCSGAPQSFLAEHVRAFLESHVSVIVLKGFVVVAINRLHGAT